MGKFSKVQEVYNLVTIEITFDTLAGIKPKPAHYCNIIPVDEAVTV